MFDGVLNTPLATRHKSSYCIFALLKFCTVFDFRKLQSDDRLFTFHTFFSFIKNLLIKNCRMLNICAPRKTHETFSHYFSLMSPNHKCFSSRVLIVILLKEFPSSFLKGFRICFSCPA